MLLGGYSALAACQPAPSLPCHYSCAMKPYSSMLRSSSPTSVQFSPAAATFFFPLTSNIFDSLPSFSTTSLSFPHCLQQGWLLWCMPGRQRTRAPCKLQRRTANAVHCCPRNPSPPLHPLVYYVVAAMLVTKRRRRRGGEVE